MSNAADSLLRARAGLVLLAAALALAGCATPPPSCTDGRQVMVSETLVFGRARPGGEVTEAEWARFLAEEVTPRFPDGFSSWPAAGQWRGADGRILKEASQVLLIVHAGGADTQARVAAVARRYRERFEQEAVLRLSQPGCVSF